MRTKSQGIVMCAVFTVLIAVGAFLKIPVQLPITLQLFFVVMSGLLLGSKLGAVSCIVYMLLGLTGVPVFTQGGGISYVFEPSFGYIIGFVFASFFTGLITERKSGYKKTPPLKTMLIASFVGLLTAYVVGMVYYYVIFNFVLNTRLGIELLLIRCVLLTAPMDIVLSVAATLLSRKLKRFMPF